MLIGLLTFIEREDERYHNTEVEGARASEVSEDLSCQTPESLAFKLVRRN